MAQVAALCYRIRKKKTHQVLLVTSRTKGRWILPKGWPMDDRSPDQAAATEAFEEAGVKGKVFTKPVGRFAFLSNVDKKGEKAEAADVYAIRVKKLAKDFPEHDQRRRRWFSAKKAAAKVTEPELSALIRAFKPEDLRKKKS